MKDEIDSMASNKVWDLINLPDGVNTMRCKRVFENKEGLQGNIERYKPRLVAQGFTQTKGIDYTETFSHVSKKDSLRIIMALVDYFDFDMHRMNVKTTFLNCELAEEGYMKQP